MNRRTDGGAGVYIEDRSAASNTFIQDCSVPHVYLNEFHFMKIILNLSRIKMKHTREPSFKWETGSKNIREIKNKNAAFPRKTEHQIVSFCYKVCFTIIIPPFRGYDDLWS